MQRHNKNSRFEKNKKGAVVGTTITWVTATLIIIAILVVFLVFAILMSKSKAVSVGNTDTDLEEKSQVLTIKTSIAETINSDADKKTIDKLLEEKSG